MIPMPAVPSAAPGRAEGASHDEGVTVRSDALRVAAIIDAAGVSGPGRQLAAVAGALAPLGVAVTVVAFDRLPMPAHLEEAPA